MKLQFDEDDIKVLLLERAAALGIKANKVEIKAGYGSIESCTVSFDESLQEAPREPA